MDKDKVFSIIRYILSAVGAWLIGHNLFGQVVDPTIWAGYVGIIMAVISLVWAFIDKTVTLESFQSVIRQVWTLIAGILVGAGKMTDETAQTILGILGFVVTLIYSKLSMVKTMRLANPDDPLTLIQLNGAKKAMKKAA